MRELVLYVNDDDQPDSSYSIEDGSVTIEVEGMAVVYTRRRKDAPR